MEFEKGKKVRVVGNSCSHQYNIGDEITMDINMANGFKAREYADGLTWGVYFSDCEEIEDKPKQYQIGIDTFEMMEKNCTLVERLAFVKGNISKYNWRDKGQDKQDFEKIIKYAEWALKQLEDEQ